MKRVICFALLLALLLPIISITPVAAASQVDMILEYANSKVGTNAFPNKCQAFVRSCYEYAGLYASASPGSAKEAYNLWCVSNSRDNIPVGACMYFIGGEVDATYGHVGIYAGNNTIIDSRNAKKGVVKEQIPQWLWNSYVGWGWQGGVAPSGSDGGSAPAQPSSNIWVSTDGADTITETNATVRGSVGYSGNRPTEAGLYFGYSADNMSKVAHDAINFSKNPFNLWYDLNGEANQYLSPGTTYYYKMYAIQNGVEVCGETKSFTTVGPQPAPEAPTTNLKAVTVDAYAFTGTDGYVAGLVTCSGNGLAEAGLYFGTSPDNMVKVISDKIEYGRSMITPSYNFNKDAGIYLTPGETYYYKMYVEENGVEVCGETKSFVSPVLQSTPTPEPNNSSSAGSNGSYSSGGRGEVKVTQVGNTVMIFVNGEKVNFTDAQPYIDFSDRTVVPVRALAEFLGAYVDWNEATQRVTIYKDGTTIALTIGSRTIEVNGVESRMDTFAVTMNDRTYLPLRYVAEALGMTVLWE